MTRLTMGWMVGEARKRGSLEIDYGLLTTDPDPNVRSGGGLTDSNHLTGPKFAFGRFPVCGMIAVTTAFQNIDHVGGM
jgi:hypothetical protein